MTTSTTVSTHLLPVYELLIEVYRHPQWLPEHDPFGSLMGTILSHHTSDINSGYAYQQLTATFQTWEEVRDAPLGDIIPAVLPVRSTGLVNIKSTSHTGCITYTH